MDLLRYIEAEDIRDNIRKRDPEAHKGNFGKVLIYAGSPGMAGAAVLCARSALRGGAGLVRIMVPSFDQNPAMLQLFQTLVPEATCVDYAKGVDFNEYNAIAAGPGLGTLKPVRMILKDIIKKYTGTLILDADALNIVAADPSLEAAVKESAASIIMTPHIGEARRLLGTSVPIKTQEERIAAGEEICQKYGVTCLLKGAGTLICSLKGADKLRKVADMTPDMKYAADNKPVFVISQNTTGNPGMATGGSGDVLTGLIAALAGQGLSPQPAACTGAYIHGLAGDLGAADLGEISLISSDIVNYLPKAFKKVF